jgi:bidirectional [NiFe] hydrogenase diaphorase subunit
MQNEQLVKIEIDGRSTEAPQGATVLQAAQKAGVEIPTLCHHEGLPTSASCRLCIVEMRIIRNGKEHQWIDASCTYPVEEGLKVNTQTEQLTEERRTIIELLISRAPESERLNQLAEEYGANKQRFTSFDQGESGCILCGNCVRVCNEIIKSSSIGTAHRGIKKKIITPLGIAKEFCMGCQACISVCPTGTIKSVINYHDKNEKPFLKIENWDVEIEMKTCKECQSTFAPLPFLEKLKQKVQLDEEIFEKCPNCRRKNFIKEY